ncbi:MAG TPA: zinc-ribbon domain-containing protein [Pyrinomonadaceae bacterium]|nr:zinc-ribbon domain-containing protein [Pyrinomonadaceae bacterium]
MALIYCPECGHEISTAAVACPNCGRPLSATRPIHEAPPVVAHVERKDGVPNWIFIPLGLIGAVLVVAFFVFMSRNNADDNSNIAVNVSARRQQQVSEPNRSDVPTNTVTAPALNVPGSQAEVSTAPPTKGSVVIDAKIASRNGAPQPVKNEKFYLLDEDLETILSNARLEPVEGQSLANSFGLSVVYPDRYSAFHRDALRAIRDHIKYSGTTDATGKAELGGIEPNSYYLFAVTKSGRGFALWSSPVSIIAGQNALNLTPQTLTEMEVEPTGD